MDLAPKKQFAWLAAWIAVILMLPIPVFSQDAGSAQRASAKQLEAMANSHSAAAVKMDDSNFSSDQLSLILHCEQFLMCACAKENFSKTLAGCPDGCANPQKNEIRSYVKQGLSFEDIREVMSMRYSQKVLADGVGNTHLLVVLLVAGAGFLVLFFVIFRFTAMGKVAAQKRQASHSLPDNLAITDEERQAVMADLKEFE